MVLSPLSSSAGYALNYARAAFSRGISANAALAAYREAGYGIRRSDFLGLYRNAKGVTEAAYHVRNIRKDYLPDPDRLPHAITSIRRDYSFNVRLDVRDSESGELIKRNITVTSDRLMSVADMESAAEEAYFDDPSYSDNELVSVTVVEAKRR